ENRSSWTTYSCVRVPLRFFSRRQDHDCAEFYVVSHNVLADCAIHLGVDLIPFFWRNKLEHGKELCGHGARLLPNFFGSSRPCPRDSPGLFYYSLETGAAQREGETAGLRIFERVLIRWHLSATHVLVYHSHRARPERLFERAPSQKASACAGSQHAARLAQRIFPEEHHAKPAGDEIEALIGKRQIIGIGLASREVRKVTFATPFFRDLQKLGAEIERDDVALGADP